MRRRLSGMMAAIALAVVLMVPELGFAAETDAHGVDGRQLGLIWAAPFVGILLSIALGPLLAPHFWEHHYGKIAAGWALAFLLPFAAVFGLTMAVQQLLHTLLLEYIPFIVLIFALFTVAGGIVVRGAFSGTPGSNTAILAVGAAAASWMGTTGASMVLIRPLIQANRWRRNAVHVFVFFIFLVSNMGGLLTPLGDPPLFLGFLLGVDFTWTLTRLIPHWLVMIVPLLAIFYVLDTIRIRGDGAPPTVPPTPLGLGGGINVVLLLAVIAATLMSANWRPGMGVSVMHIDVALQNIVRDVLLIAIALLSYRLTPAEAHEANEFSFGPIKEVAKLFIGIFITIAPVIAMLAAGREGALSGLVALSTQADGSPSNAMYFWLTGFLSSFLDNAPTYLVFFQLAGGDPARLMGELATTLAAISCGAVFMGANSYIGNAPNFMVKAVCESRGIRMPSFFGYCAWAVVFLVPLYAVVTWLFFLR